ncbi:hypothetical protein ElyMa_001228600 [Elysia marginata]|uniref:Uncharacterized protein n=1 Tax=Elysia marginata TaxID=1093978 RepID=A0AAV4IC30_9GAST|nr:hypothetical protein ElyMa_001228600 [Elysia marginata]
MEAIRSLDCDLILSLVPDSCCCTQQPKLSSEEIRTAFRVAVDGLVQTKKVGVQAARLVYLLRNLGARINLQDEVRPYSFHLIVITVKEARCIVRALATSRQTVCRKRFSSYATLLSANDFKKGTTFYKMAATFFKVATACLKMAATQRSWQNN